MKDLSSVSFIEDGPIRAKYAPDNLIRQRKQPTAFISNMQPINPQLQYYPEQVPIYLSNKRFKYRPKQLLGQYYNPQSYLYPNQQRTRKAAQFTGYNFSQINSSIIGEKTKANCIQSRQQKQQPQHPFRQNNKQKSSFPSIDPSQINKRELLKQPTLNRSQSVSLSQKTSHNSNTKTDLFDQSITGSDRKIFRGLGFNIISNRSYQYVFSIQKQRY